MSTEVGPAKLLPERSLRILRAAPEVDIIDETDE
jgi:hypothetical protein